MWLECFDVKSFLELYMKLTKITRNYKPLDYNEIPFCIGTFLDYKALDEGEINQLDSFLSECWCAYMTNKLVPELRKNPPKEGYENPVVMQLPGRSGVRQINLWTHLIAYGVDLPGARYNPVGMGYYSELFFHMFFGNYTEFIQHIENLTPEELDKTLKRREGYGQYSIIMAPIIGRNMVRVERNGWISPLQKREIRAMYHGANEDRQFEILNKLLELGADPNAYDIAGLTGLFHATEQDPVDCIKIMQILLKHGADPNLLTSLFGMSILSYVCDFYQDGKENCAMIMSLLLRYNATPTCCENAFFVRHKKEEESKNESSVNNLFFKFYTDSHSANIAEQIRKHLPKKSNICDMCWCLKSATNKCSACSKVFYCSKQCQKYDWNSHKAKCVKKKKEGRK